MVPTELFIILSVICIPGVYSFDARISRLVNGSTLYSGRVELGGYMPYAVKPHIIWSTVDGRFFDTTKARILCRSLGYRDGVDREQAFYGQGSGSIYRMDHCSGKEYSLWECPHVDCVFGCSHRFDAGVECNGTGQPKPQNMPDGLAKVRLRGGSDRYSGIVEVFHNHEWGALCDNNIYGMRNAFVICRSLGFREGVRLNWRNSSHGNDTRPIWISNVRCSGDEYSITVCPYDVYDNAAKIQTCTHVNDLAIRCKSPLDCKQCVHMFSCDQATNECTCETGWTGKLCDMDIDECVEPATNNCPLNTTCINTEGSYYCLRTQEKIKTDIKVEQVPLIVVASVTGFVIICLIVGFIIRNRTGTSKESRYTQFGQTHSVEPVKQDDHVSSGLESSQTSTETRVIGMAGPMRRVQPCDRNEISVTTETEYEVSDDTRDEVGIDSHTEVKQPHE